ncbi:hypothetical protein D9M68_761520 [compost metagenome]
MLAELFGVSDQGGLEGVESLRGEEGFGSGGAAKQNHRRAAGFLQVGFQSFAAAHGAEHIDLEAVVPVLLAAEAAGGAGVMYEDIDATKSLGSGGQPGLVGVGVTHVEGLRDYLAAMLA